MTCVVGLAHEEEVTGSRKTPSESLRSEVLLDVTVPRVFASLFCQLHKAFITMVITLIVGWKWNGQSLPEVLTLEQSYVISAQGHMGIGWMGLGCGKAVDSPTFQPVRVCHDCLPFRILTMDDSFRWLSLYHSFTIWCFAISFTDFMRVHHVRLLKARLLMNGISRWVHGARKSPMPKGRMGEEGGEKPDDDNGGGHGRQLRRVSFPVLCLLV